MIAGSQAGTIAVQDRLAERLEAIVTKKIANDQLVLPSIPAVAAKALALTKDPDFSLQAAAGLIGKDPTLTAQLLKLASSAGMGAREPVKAVLAAVTRLGVEKLRGFLIESSARKVFESRDTRISTAFQGLWEHSLAVALLTRDVIAESGGNDPDLGYLAGLLHDIGKPVVAALLLETEKSVTEAKATPAWISGAEWVGVIQRCHQKVGVALAEKWELPDAVARAIRDCADYDHTDRSSVANVVRFANALAKQIGVAVGEFSKPDIDELVTIGRSILNVDEALVARLSASIRETIKTHLS